MLDTFKMNVIIQPSQNQQSQQEQYQEVVNDLGGYYYEKYTLINGKKNGLYEYRYGTIPIYIIEFKNDIQHGKDITYHTYDLTKICVAQCKEWLNGKLNGYCKSYNRHGMPTSVAYYQHGHMDLHIQFKDDGSIDYENSQIPNHYNINSITNMIFNGININECMERKKMQDKEDEEDKYLSKYY
jgi:hypothetical protein